MLLLFNDCSILGTRTTKSSVSNDCVAYVTSDGDGGAMQQQEADDALVADLSGHPQRRGAVGAPGVDQRFAPVGSDVFQDGAHHSIVAVLRR